MKISYPTLLLIGCMILGASGNACNCSNGKIQGSTSPPTSPPRPTTPPPPQPAGPLFLQKLSDARAQLKAVNSQPGSTPELKDIERIFERYAPANGSLTFKRPGTDEVIAQFNSPRDSKEIFNNLLAARAYERDVSKVINWAIEKNIIDINSPNNQGFNPLEAAMAAWIDCLYDNVEASGLANITQNLLDKGATLTLSQGANLLEKLIEDHFIKDNPQPHHTVILDTLKKEGVHLPPDKASRLLEKLVERQLTGKEDLKLQVLSDRANFLQAQGGAIPAANTLVLLEKFIQKGRKTSTFSSREEQEKERKLHIYILGLLQQGSSGAASSQKATDLLQQALDKVQVPELYKLLIQQGADPNAVQVKKDYTPEKVSLLHYAASKSFEEGFKELLQELINNPMTNVNVIGENNFTVAMKEAYTRAGSTFLVDQLLQQRDDLDINTIEASYLDVTGDTLLDMVVKNCIANPEGGHEWQIEAAINNSKRWLNTLKKMKSHPKFQVSKENQDKAHARYLYMKKNSLLGLNPTYLQQATTIAQEAVDLLK